MRTPLNTVFLGLNLSLDHIPHNTTDPSELERRQTLTETVSACSAELDILNELLLYDKLESGVLVLNKEHVCISDIIYDSIKMFNVQVREKNIDLIITNNTTNNISSTSLLFMSEYPSFTSLTDGATTTNTTTAINTTNNNNTTNNTIYNTNFNLPFNTNTTSVPDLNLTLNQVYTLPIYTSDSIELDRNKMIQVLRNVISNAIKFTPINGRILVDIKFEPDMVRIMTLSNLQIRHLARRLGVPNMRSIHNSNNNNNTNNSNEDIEMNMSSHTVHTHDSVDFISESGLDVIPGHLIITITDTGMYVYRLCVYFALYCVILFNV